MNGSFRRTELGVAFIDQSARFLQRIGYLFPFQMKTHDLSSVRLRLSDAFERWMSFERDICRGLGGQEAVCKPVSHASYLAFSDKTRTFP